MKRIVIFTWATAAAVVLLCAQAGAQDGSLPGWDPYSETGVSGGADRLNDSKFGAKIGKGRTSVDPETVKLMRMDAESDQRIRNLAVKYKATTDASERGTIASEIRELVAKQFEARQGLRERQLVELEEQVKRLRTIHAERSTQRDRIVADRAQQLIRDAEGLGWGDVDEAAGRGWVFDDSRLGGVSPPIKVFRRSELDMFGAEEPPMSEEGQTIR